jgi:hypothetical protein
MDADKFKNNPQINADQKQIQSADYADYADNNKDKANDLIGFNPRKSAQSADKGILTIHSIGGGVLFACLSERILVEDVEALAQGIVTWHKQLAPAGNTTCVFRDSAFENDIAKSNLAAILEQYGIANVRSL